MDMALVPHVQRFRQSAQVEIKRSADPSDPRPPLRLRNCQNRTIEGMKLVRQTSTSPQKKTANATGCNYWEISKPTLRMTEPVVAPATFRRLNLYGCSGEQEHARDEAR